MQDQQDTSSSVDEAALRKLQLQIQMGIDDLEAGRATEYEASDLNTLGQRIKARGRAKLEAQQDTGA